jgi:hypothetical protein
MYNSAIRNAKLEIRTLYAFRQLKLELNEALALTVNTAHINSVCELLLPFVDYYMQALMDLIRLKAKSNYLTKLRSNTITKNRNIQFLKNRVTSAFYQVTVFSNASLCLTWLKS